MHPALLVLLLVGPSIAAAGSHSFKGQVVVPDPRLADNVVLELSTSNGQRIRAFSDKTGGFVFNGVPTGTHLLHVLTLGYMFPEFRVEISSNGLAKVAFSHDPKQVLPSKPLLVRPLGPVSYYELRQPFNAWGFIKSPMGLMMCFMAFALFVVPHLKMDPEELKELKAARAGREGSAGGGSQQARLRDRQ